MSHFRMVRTQIAWCAMAFSGLAFAQAQVAPTPATAQTVYRPTFPFLRASAEHWNLEIDRRDDGTYPARLTWEMGGRHADGVVAKAGEGAYPENYEGELIVDGSKRRIFVHAVDKPCRDESEQQFELTVTVRVDGIDSIELGCGAFVLPDPP